MQDVRLFAFDPQRVERDDLGHVLELLRSRRKVADGFIEDSREEFFEVALRDHRLVGVVVGTWWECTRGGGGRGMGFD